MVSLDVAHLPYNRPLLDYLRDEHAAGRKLYLATGADRVLAQKIAAHLGIFEEVMASDGSSTYGNNKLHHLEQRFAGRRLRLHRQCNAGFAAAPGGATGDARQSSPG